jgi:hypothetical protein
MDRKLSVSIPEFKNGGLMPGTFEEFLEHIHRPGGFWQVLERDKLTGRVLAEQWLENTYTDNGVSVMYHALANAASFTQAQPANIIAIDASLGWTTLTSSIASGGTVTSITVGALIGPTIPSGTTLWINPGVNNTLTSSTLVVVTTQAITGAGTFTVTSVAGPAATIASGSSVRYAYSAVPTLDPGSLSAPVSYTAALPSGQFTYAMTTGYGNRSLAVTNNSAYLFSTTGSPAASAGNYTCAWLCNANPVAATSNTFVRVAFDNSLTINSTTAGQINITEKL